MFSVSFHCHSGISSNLTDWRGKVKCSKAITRVRMPYTRMPVSPSRLDPVRGAVSDRMAYSTAIVECHAEKCKSVGVPRHP
jgi:hypothetical protein